MSKSLDKLEPVTHDWSNSPPVIDWSEIHDVENDHYSDRPKTFVRCCRQEQFHFSSWKIKCESRRQIQITPCTNPNNNIKYDSNLPPCGFGMIPVHRKAATTTSLYSYPRCCCCCRLERYGMTRSLFKCRELKNNRVHLSGITGRRSAFTQRWPLWLFWLSSERMLQHILQEQQQGDFSLLRILFQILRFENITKEVVKTLAQKNNWFLLIKGSVC